jgi:hypothetical protein
MSNQNRNPGQQNQNPGQKPGQEQGGGNSSRTRTVKGRTPVSRNRRPLGISLNESKGSPAGRRGFSFGRRSRPPH